MRVVGVGEVPVEEVLGVEEHLQALCMQKGDRVGDHGDALVERRPQRLGDVQLRGLGDDADGLGLGLDQEAQGLVLVGADAGAAGRPEGHELGRGEAQLGRGADEELLVLRVGAGPPPLDVGDAQVVELLGHPELVVDGQGEPLLLAAVSQGRVEHVDGLGEAGQLVAVALGGVTVPGRPCGLAVSRHRSSQSLYRSTSPRTVAK